MGVPSSDEEQLKSETIGILIKAPALADRIKDFRFIIVVLRLIIDGGIIPYSPPYSFQFLDPNKNSWKWKNQTELLRRSRIPGYWV